MLEEGTSPRESSSTRHAAQAESGVTCPAPTFSDQATRVAGWVSLLALFAVAAWFGLSWATGILARQYTISQSSHDAHMAQAAKLLNHDPGLERRLRFERMIWSVGAKRLLQDDLGNIRLVSGPFDWWQRNLEDGNAESRVALGVVLAVVAMILVGPALALLVLMRRWRPRSRAGFAIRFSMCGAAIVGWPTLPLLMKMADGDYTDLPEAPLLAAFSNGAAYAAALAFLSLGLGSWLGGKRFTASRMGSP